MFDIKLSEAVQNLESWVCNAKAYITSNIMVAIPVKKSFTHD